MKRRADAAALHSVDRCAAYFNSTGFYRLVLQLEAYRGKMERSHFRRLFLGSAPADWADDWLDRRVALDAEAVQMEAARVEIKNVWYLAKQAWECHPGQRELIREFFFDAPLNSALAVRSLRLLEPMDRARFRRRGFEYARPSIYPFIASLYGIDGDGDAQPAAEGGSSAARSLDSQPWWFMQASRR